MNFEVGDVIQVKDWSIDFTQPRYIVVDVSERGMHVQTIRKGRSLGSSPAWYIPPAEYRQYEVVEGQPVQPRVRQGRRLEL